VSDTFSWSSANEPPVITVLEPSVSTVLLGSVVTWSAAATDPGSADSLAWSFDGGVGWGTGWSTSWDTSYSTCGSYALHASVTDDDGGSASAVSTRSVTAIGAGLVEPASTGGVEIGRQARVVPLKVHVGCSEANTNGLHPEVWVGNVLMGTMREQDDFYRLNVRIDRPGMIRIAPFGLAGGAIEIPVRLR
jgi:hypothetical protein